MSVAEPYSLDVILLENNTCLVSWRAGEDYTDTDVQWTGGGSSGSLGAQTEGESAEYTITELFTANTEYTVWATGYVNGENNYVETTVTRYVDSGSDTYTWGDDTEETKVTVDSVADTMTLSDATSDIQVISDSAVDTLILTDNVADLAVVSLEIDYQYMFGSFDGKVYAEGSDYKSDDGTAINAYLVTKQSDFADQNQEALDKFKTLYKVRLWYVDTQANATAVVHASTDGGQTWTSKAKSMGNGDGTIKSLDYWFHMTGETFQFKVSNNTPDEVFQWTALEAYYEISGDYFAI